MKKVIFLICIFAILVFIAISCKNMNPSVVPDDSIQLIKTELGGCNTRGLALPKSAQRFDDDSDGIIDDGRRSPDTVTVFESKDSINIFVGLNYTCKYKPFKTRYEITSNIIYIYIIDDCRVFDCMDSCRVNSEASYCMDHCYSASDYDYGCYTRCDCYYTFDFIFKGTKTLNQKYKVLLINPDPNKESPVIISEGVIAE